MNASVMQRLKRVAALAPACLSSRVSSGAMLQKLYLNTYSHVIFRSIVNWLPWTKASVDKSLSWPRWLRSESLSSPFHHAVSVLSPCPRLQSRPAGPWFRLGSATTGGARSFSRSQVNAALGAAPALLLSSHTCLQTRGWAESSSSLVLPLAFVENIYSCCTVDKELLGCTLLRCSGFRHPKEIPCL